MLTRSRIYVGFPRTRGPANPQSTGEIRELELLDEIVPLDITLLFRWYHLPRVGDCVQFPWGGCHGNDNNFVSIGQCRATCRVWTTEGGAPHSLLSVLSSSSIPPPVTKTQSQHCLLPPESGPCSDRIQRFYFDSQSRSCLR